MKKFKKIIAMAGAVIMAVSAMSMSVFAENDNIIKIPELNERENITIPIGDAEYIEDVDGNITVISELPQFDTNEEAELFVNNLKNGIKQSYNPVAPLATRGDVQVASYNAGDGYVRLCVRYTTSGNSNTGTITSHEAYSYFDGYTLFMTWNPTICYSEVTQSGKDIYAYVNGNLTYRVQVGGSIEVGNVPVTLSGYAYVIH